MFVFEELCLFYMSHFRFVYPTVITSIINAKKRIIINVKSSFS